MAYIKRNTAGLISVQVWISKKVHHAAKERLCREGKTFRELITKFLRWYGGTEGQDDNEETAETSKTD